MSRSTTRLTVVGRIREELGQLRAVVERVARIWDRAYQSDADDYFLDAVALNLHGFYAGIEQLLLAIRGRARPRREPRLRSVHTVPV